MSLTATPGQETVAPGRRPHVGALSKDALWHAGDDRLVALTRAGSERAFAEIMRRYQRPLQFYCFHIVGAPRAEDAVQQAFMQAFISLRDGEHREIALRPWLYRIARNCAIDLLRKQPLDHDELDPEYDGMPQPPGLLEQKEELARVVAAIQALPEGQRRALTLRELEGRSYGEISAELGHSDSSVRQLIFRARTALRNLGALVFPVGSVQWRLLGAGAPAGDPHHVAAAATVSSSGGGSALQAAGSVVAATLTLLAAGPPPEQHSAHTATQAAPIQAISQGGVVASPALVAGVAPVTVPHERRPPHEPEVDSLAVSTPAADLTGQIVPAPIVVAAPAPPPVEPAVSTVADPAAPPPDAVSGRTTSDTAALALPGDRSEPSAKADASPPAESVQAPTAPKPPTPPKPTAPAGTQIVKPAKQVPAASKPPARPKAVTVKPVAPKKPTAPKPPAAPPKAPAASSA